MIFSWKNHWNSLVDEWHWVIVCDLLNHPCQMILLNPLFLICLPIFHAPFQLFQPNWIYDPNNISTYCIRIQFNSDTRSSLFVRLAKHFIYRAYKPIISLFEFICVAVILLLLPLPLLLLLLTLKVRSWYAAQLWFHYSSKLNIIHLLEGTQLSRHIHCLHKQLAVPFDAPTSRSLSSIVSIGRK